MRRGLVAWLVLCVGVALLAMSPRPAPLAQQCANAYISSPRAGATTRGDVEVTGSANIDRFQFYKVEFSPINNPDAWSAVSSTVRQPAVNGRLDVWNTRAVPDGLYILKLTVVDDRGQEVCRSVVPQIQVINTVRGQPTDTPQVTDTPAATETPQGLPTAGTRTPTPGTGTPGAGTPTIPPLPTIPPPPPGPTAASVAQAAAPSPTAGVRTTATPAAAPARTSLSSLIPDLSGVRSAFDMSRVRDAFLLGAIATVAAFTFVGLILLLRRLL